MDRKLTLIYWKSEKFWIGKLLEYPEIMTQGESLNELERNIEDAFQLMVLDEIPDKYMLKELAVATDVQKYNFSFCLLVPLGTVYL